VARILVRVGVIAAALAATSQLFPSGDGQGQQLARHQPATLAAMEGLFETPPAGAPLVIVGQPNVPEKRIDNTIEVPRMLSFLTYKRWDARVQGLDTFPPDARPDNIALLYYSYHVMVGLGTILIAIAGVAFLLLLRGRLMQNRTALWALLLAAPLPYIANTAGWMTAEIGRQPWLVYGLMRTADGTSHRVSEGNALFSLLGFMGLYSLLLIVFVLLTARVIAHGPQSVNDGGTGVVPGPTPGAA
jgi:cytochrome d ubiquinol oxidase subunit I